MVLLILAYPGYPIVLAILPKKRGYPHESGVLPTVSIVLVARNEAERIEKRLLNLLEVDCAIQELVLVCDGCTDATAEIARSIAHPAIRVIELDTPKGKPGGVNMGVLATSAEVIVLCDARQRFDRQTIPTLVRWFEDENTGAVSGALEIETANDSSGQGVDAYWRLEKAIRQMESDLDSCVGCTGAVYAVRRACFQPLAEDIILDDVVVPMQIAATGHRVRFDATAHAYDPQPLTGELEQRRKIRTLAGNFQMLTRYPAWVLPWGHRLWWNLIAHKYLRLLGPILLTLVLLASLLLLQRPFYRVALVLQVGVGLLALIGWMAPGQRSRVVTLPAGFLFLQWCVVKGFLGWLLGSPGKGWR
jgi:cellulose synthase/poly-beta-1,6-N-acetylglucosamine synthase-like glycosyltransferase